MELVTKLARRRRESIWLSGLFCACVAAVVPGAAEPPAPRFANLTKDQGLPDNTVEAIVEDHRGFMWFGTPDGLARYDAHSVSVYRHDPLDPRSLSSSYVNALFEDREKVLWIATHEGLNAYDRKTDSFIRYPHDEEDPTSLSHSHVNEIFEDRQGELWIATGAGVSRFDRATGTFHRYPPEEYSPQDPLCASNPRAIIEDGRGDLWLGLERCGLVRLDRRTGTIMHFRHREGDPASLGHDDVWDLVEGDDGSLWIATMGGLDRFDPASGSSAHFVHDLDDPQSLSTNHVDALLEDRDGNLWVGTDGGGLALFDRATGTFASFRHDSSDEETIGSDVIRTIYEDSKGDLWVGTYTGGVGFYSGTTTQFSHYQHSPNDPDSLSHSAVLSFSEDEDGTLWIGTEGGLNRFDPRTRTFSVYRHDPRDPASISADAVLAVLRDSRGHLWAGTYHGGLNRLNPDGRTFRHLQHDENDPRSLGNPHVWSLFEDSSREFWQGTFDGVSRFDYDSESFIRYVHDPDDETSVGHRITWSFYEDRDGTLWLATLWGLSRYDRVRDNFRTYRHDEEDPKSLSHDEVLSILEDRDGRLWIGTEGGGLNLFDRETETFRAFRTREGLPNDKVYGILEDDRGRLWISTNAGLSRFDPKAETFVNYNDSDGLRAYPFFRNACLESRSGEMYFGGINGFSSFFPDAIMENTLVPPVVLTDFQIFNRPVALDVADSPLDRHITEASEIRLRHNQSVISFSFSALNYRAAEKNQYSYVLEGFEQDWNLAGPRRTATYTNLDPGHYTFRVRASNNSGVWNEAGAAIDVVVSPPFWATWWFRFLAVLAIGASLFGVYQERTRAMRSRNLVLQKEIEERRRVEMERERLMLEMTEKSALLEAQNAELERFTYTVSHDLTTPLVTIKGFLGVLERDASAGDPERIRDDIEIIGSAADKMHRLLGELLDLSRVGRVANPSEVVPLSDLARDAVKLVQGPIRDRGVEVEVDAAMPVAVVDKIRILEVYQNLIDNAVRFMGRQTGPRVTIGAEKKNGELLCFVRDNGMGIHPSYQERVFELFERLDAADERSTGIGLALVKRIIEVHGGRIWVESEGAGQGSCFYFTLPSAESPSPFDRAESPHCFPGEA